MIGNIGKKYDPMKKNKNRQTNEEWYIWEDYPMTLRKVNYVIGSKYLDLLKILVHISVRKGKYIFLFQFFFHNS
jgi:hypothetical protein